MDTVDIVMNIKEQHTI